MSEKGDYSANTFFNIIKCADKFFSSKIVSPPDKGWETLV